MSTDSVTATQRLLGMDEYPIHGWARLPAELTRPDVFERIKRCGINVFYTCDAPEARQRQLDLAAQHGLRAIVHDPAFLPQKDPPAGWRTRLDETVKPLLDHQAVAGFYVFDEPEVGDSGERANVDACKPWMDAFAELAPDKIAYINALGFSARGLDSFADYIDRYTEVLKPQMISFDCYPITRQPPAGASWAGFYEDDCGEVFPELGAYRRAGYFESWGTVLETARRHGLPSWGFVNAVPHTHSNWFYGPVTEGTLRFEAFTALAHGAEAVQHYAMRTNTANAKYDHAILDPDGDESIRYAAFRKVNREVQVFGSCINKLTVQAVFATGDTPSGCKAFRTGRYPTDSSHRPLAAAEGDAVLLSFMKSKSESNERWLFVVNRNPALAARLQLRAWPGWSFTEVTRHNGQLRDKLGAVCLCNLEPGDARLYRLTPADEEL